MKVLVVDDDPGALTGTEAGVRGLGHDVVTRDRALGTTAAIWRERPDVALIDIEMPGLTGDDLVRAADEKQFVGPGRETAFIFYSGRDRDELEQLVKETIAVGAIDKASGPTGLAEQFDAIVSKL
jgi:CheY-like chemotaxis protein